ncbi:MAG TPA: DUF2142 domain-containing protein [Candidatus Acidoferrales bacterium]|nr:DUF2142 domain-containing protein [Candidatus Acidoferrales bacterium]
MKQTARPLGTGTGKIAVLLGLLAAAHVFFYAATFPFYSVVDEQMHVDLAVRYSHADIPRSLTPPDTNALPFLVIYASPEFLQVDGPIAPPPWKQPMDAVRDRLVAKQVAYQEKFQNHEASQPPLYYALAGAWWRLGKALSLDGLTLLYWLRFLNVPLVIALVWLGWTAARKLFPENPLMQVMVPAFIACLPQTMFYAVNNDILSPLAFGAAFVLVLKFWDAETPTLGLAVATGLALAAAFLTKISNLPLLAVAGLFLISKVISLGWQKRLNAAVSPLAALVVCAAGPVAAWMAWCSTNFGDLTGSSLKIKFLNWTDKPVGEWLHHPLFTEHGFWYFLKTNLATFWQGEQLWHRQPLANPAVDEAYVVLTLGALALALVALVRPRSRFTTSQRRAVAFGFLCCGAMLAFFALLSVKYDFQDCFYPSREHPYFVSGRLLLGMLIPFLLVFAAGLDRLMSNFQMPTKIFLLVLLLGFMLGSEVATDLPVFGSEYNWLNQ